MRVASKFYINSEMVRDWLRRKGHGEAWLSEELGVHFNTVRNMLAHRRTPLPATVEKLAQLMRVKVESLLVERV